MKKQTWAWYCDNCGNLISTIDEGAAPFHLHGNGSEPDLCEDCYDAAIEAESEETTCKQLSTS